MLREKFPGWKTMHKNQVISRTRNSEFPGLNLETKRLGCPNLCDFERVYERLILSIDINMKIILKDENG